MRARGACARLPRLVKSRTRVGRGGERGGGGRCPGLHLHLVSLSHLPFTWALHFTRALHFTWAHLHALQVKSHLRICSTPHAPPPTLRVGPIPCHPPYPATLPPSLPCHPPYPATLPTRPPLHLYQGAMSGTLSSANAYIADISTPKERPALMANVGTVIQETSRKPLGKPLGNL